ncbi:MAG: dTDP-4-amino-4,6-dideoxygalactose transaminase [Patulibacter minatonensis]
MSIRPSGSAPISEHSPGLAQAGSPAPAAVVDDVPFTRVQPCSDGVAAIAEIVADGALKAGGRATQRCAELITASVGALAVLMVGSCTTALELSALLLDLRPGDEVIMPSFGYASAANAFVLRGAVPVFVDILPGTFGLDPLAVRAAITPRTRAIVPVHYAGVAAELDTLQTIASEHDLAIVEDAAQGLGASYAGRPLGAIGALGAFSFDATKNLTCGAGGALVVSDPGLVERAEWLRDCGTDRAGFLRGHKSRYEWVEVGTNAALNELAAAYLVPQLERLDQLTAARVELWNRYHELLAPLEADGLLGRPIVPAGAVHNGHAYVVTLRSAQERAGVIERLASAGVQATFHFVPLHSAPAGLRYGRTAGDLQRTDDLAARLLRLPLWNGMPLEAVDRVAGALRPAISDGDLRVWSAS